MRALHVVRARADVVTTKLGIILPSSSSFTILPHLREAKGPEQSWGKQPSDWFFLLALAGGVRALCVSEHPLWRTRYSFFIFLLSMHIFSNLRTGVKRSDTVLRLIFFVGSGRRSVCTMGKWVSPPRRMQLLRRTHFTFKSIMNYILLKENEIEIVGHLSIFTKNILRQPIHQT